MENISSFDDLKNTEQPVENNQFASYQLKVINDYIKTTGRTVQDYINTQTVDLSNVSDDYQNWIKSNISNDALNVRALMARTNRILNLSECNAYEAPFSTKNSKLSLPGKL